MKMGKSYVLHGEGGQPAYCIWAWELLQLAVSAYNVQIQQFILDVKAKSLGFSVS